MASVPSLPLPLPLPPLWREGRPLRETVSLLRDPVWRGEGIPDGDGTPVLLISGFLAGDESLGLMARWLHRLGYRPRRAGIRANVGCGGRTTDRLEQSLERIADEHGGPVSVIGQSRGGTFARVLAARRPDLVDNIVTLGSPLVDHLDVHPLVWAQVHVLGALGTLGLPGVFSHRCRYGGGCCSSFDEQLRAPLDPDVRFTSVFSRSDGIVRWRSCLAEGADFVEVRSSHLGMGAHPDVYRAIAGALAGEPAPARRAPLAQAA